MPNVYFNALLGDVPLFVDSISTDRGRDIVTQSPANGDKHVNVDRGRRQQRTSIELKFVDVPGAAPYLDRYDELIRMMESGVVAIFSHPLDGSYRARVANVTPTASADELCVLASAELLREDPPRPIAELGGGISAIAGPEAMAVASAIVDEKLADVGLSSAVPGDTRITVDSWSSGLDLDAQRVYLEVETLCDRIDTMIVDLGLATDLSRYQAYQAAIRMRDTLRNAADAFTSDTPRVFDVLVDAPMPVIAICSDVYGAELALEMADAVTKLNRIRTPALVPRGTTLKMPSVSR